MNALIQKASLFSKCLLPLRINCIASLRDYPIPPSYQEVEFPEKNKLKILPKVPTYPPGFRPPKCTKRLRDIRGPELVHTEFLHKQFGMVALYGGYLKHGHLEMIRNAINRKMDAKKMFAVWRVDAPWKPITKKGQGKRMGGGKAAIHHYVTPVKAGRVILEMGGPVEFEQVHKIMRQVSIKMPFKTRVLSHEMLEKMKEDEKRLNETNINPYTYKYIVENNMLGCHRWISPYDLIWHGKFR